MADNTLQTGNDTIATDDIGGGVKVARGKVGFGVDGSYVDVSASNPLPVTVASLPLPSGAATAANQSTGNVSLASIDTKLTALVVTGSGVFNVRPASPDPADYLPVRLTDGTDFYDSSGGSGGGLTDAELRATPIPVGGTVTANAGTNLNTSALALESGGNLATLTTKDFATESTLTTASGSLLTIAGKLPATLGQKAMAASLAVTFASDQSALTVSGSGVFDVRPASPDPADYLPVRLTDGTGFYDASGGVGLTDAELRASAVPVSVATVPTHAVTQSGTWTVQPGNTANTTAWLVTGTGGTFPATQSGAWNVTNISGTISLPTGAATAAKQPALGTAGSASSDVLTVQGVASMTALKVDGSAITQPISGTVTANLGTIAGVATETTLAALSAKVTACDTGAVVLTTSSAVIGHVIVDSAPTTAVTGTFWQVTQPVSAASLPLPSGASTSAKQPALGTAGTASADVLSVQGIASMTALKVDGSAVTQPVSASSLPLPSGASTSANQPALGTAGTASSDVLTVQGIASMTALKVDGSAVTQPVSLASVPSHAVTNAGTFATQAAQSGTWTVQPGNTANTTAWKVDGSAVTQPVSIATAPVLVAGSAVIGKVGIDQTTPGTTNGVQVNAALPSGTNTIGVAIAPHQTGAVYSGTTALTPKFAAITSASSGNTTVVAAVTSKKIRVLSYRFQADADVSVKFRDNTAAVDLTGAMATGAKGGGGGASYSPCGHFETASGNALSINLSGSVQVSGHLVYLEI